jgi:predicted nucleic acid-binding protein
LLVLDRLEAVVQSIDTELYEDMQQQALQRIAVRDADDWPVLACAMTLSCPIWTEDADFFGTGVPTWTSDRIALYFV